MRLCSPLGFNSCLIYICSQVMVLVYKLLNVHNNWLVRILVYIGEFHCALERNSLPGGDAAVQHQSAGH